jgi:hypothetical protein
MQRSLASRGASAHAQDGKCSTESEFFDNGRICQQDVKSSEIASMILFDAAQFFQKKKTERTETQLGARSSFLCRSAMVRELGWFIPGRAKRLLID